MKTIAFALFFASLVTAAPASVAQETLTANPALSTIALTLMSQSKSHAYRVEVARTPLEQARGLMARRSLARGHGMIFPMVPPREASFWMEGTVMPLDLIFIAPDHHVRRIAPNAVPFDRTEIPSQGIVAAVLELKAGEAARIGLRPGDVVGYTLD